MTEPVSQPPSRIKFVRILQAVSYMSIIPAALFFIYEQNAMRRAAQIEAAQSMMLHANSAEISALATKLNAPWLEADYVEFRAAGPSFAANEAKKEQKFEQHKISLPEILQLANFYEVVLMCKESKNCDTRSIETYFGEEMRQFACFFSPQFDAIVSRVGRTDMLRLLRAHAGNCEEE